MKRKYDKGPVLTPLGIIHCDSGAEKRVLKTLPWKRIKSIYRHWPIDYIFYGKPKTFLVDFLLTFHNGTRQLIEVKGGHLMKLRSTQAKIKAAQAYCKLNHMKWRLIVNA